MITLNVDCKQTQEQKEDLSKQANEIPNHLKYKIEKIEEAINEQFDSLKSLQKNTPSYLLPFIDKEESQIKERINYLNGILFGYLSQHLYSSLAVALPNLASKKIIITGNIFSDGLGDYYHIINTADMIKKYYPSANVEVIACFLDSIPQRLRETFYPFKVNLCQKTLTENTIEAAKEADLLFEVSRQVFSDKKFVAIAKEKQKLGNYEFVGEYGYDKSYKCDYPSMGVNITQRGIVIKNQPPTKSLLDIKNKNFKLFLFNKDNPLQNDLDNYLQKHLPFASYMNSGSYYQIAFIYTIVNLQQNSSKVLDLFIPNVHPDFLNFEYLKNKGIASVEFVKKQNDHFISEEQTLAEKGTKLRLIDLYPFDQEDFHALISHCSPIVGCTGDVSMGEVVSFDRIPFYEIRNSKDLFWEDMIELVKNVGPHIADYFKELYRLLTKDQIQDDMITYTRYGSKQEKDFVVECFKSRKEEIIEISENLANLLNNEDLFKEYSAMKEIVKKYFNYNLLIKDIVAKRLAFQEYPELHKYEQELYRKIRNKELNVTEASQLLKDRLSIYRR